MLIKLRSLAKPVQFEGTGTPAAERGSRQGENAGGAAWSHGAAAEGVVTRAAAMGHAPQSRWTVSNRALVREGRKQSGVGPEQGGKGGPERAIGDGVGDGRSDDAQSTEQHGRRVLECVEFLDQVPEDDDLVIPSSSVGFNPVQGSSDDSDLDGERREREEMLEPAGLVVGAVQSGDRQANRHIGAVHESDSGAKKLSGRAHRGLRVGLEFKAQIAMIAVVSDRVKDISGGGTKSECQQIIHVTEASYGATEGGDKTEMTDFEVDTSEDSERRGKRRAHSNTEELTEDFNAECEVRIVEVEANDFCDLEESEPNEIATIRERMKDDRRRIRVPPNASDTVRA